MRHWCVPEEGTRRMQHPTPEVKILGEDSKDAHHGAREDHPGAAPRGRPTLQHHVRRELFAGEAKTWPFQEPVQEQRRKVATSNMMTLTTPNCSSTPTIEVPL